MTYWKNLQLQRCPQTPTRGFAPGPHWGPTAAPRPPHHFPPFSLFPSPMSDLWTFLVMDLFSHQLHWLCTSFLWLEWGGGCINNTSDISLLIDLLYFSCMMLKAFLNESTQMLILLNVICYCNVYIGNCLSSETKQVCLLWWIWQIKMSDVVF